MAAVEFILIFMVVFSASICVTLIYGAIGVLVAVSMDLPTGQDEERVVVLWPFALVAVLYVGIVRLCVRAMGRG